MKSLKISFGTGLLVFLCATACAVKATSDSGGDMNDSAPVSDVDPSASPSPSPTATSNVAYANGWSAITIHANFAKTHVDITGHFDTDRNACGKDAAGLLGLDDWNKFAKDVNTALESPPLAQEYCIPQPDTGKYMDGTTEVVLTRGKRLLYEVKNGEICSTVGGPALSSELLNLINKIINLADKANCPNGWGSG